MKKLLSVFLILVLALGLAACGNSGNAASNSDYVPATPPAGSASDLATPAPTATPEPPAVTDDVPGAPVSDIDTELPVRVMVMNGPTGFGMAKLISDANAGEAALNYSISVESDASNVTAALISGDVDIAVIPTNAAANVYNKTNGGVVAAAEVVRGNLYLLQNTEHENIASVADLAGKTVYAPAQNPTFIFNYISQENGLDVVADNTYAQPADLRTALAAGEVDLAVLPEPMVTIALAANDKLAIALDLDAVWNETADSGIVLGCVAVRTAFAEAHPAELAAFLNEYAASVDFVTANPEEGGALIAETGIFAQAPVATKAIPRCGLCFVTEDHMRVELSAYLSALFEIAPQSIGGAIPGDDFYYRPLYPGSDGFGGE